MDQIKDKLDQLADLADDDVSKLQTEIISEFEVVEKEEPTPQTVDAMTSLADMLDTVRGEVKRRETQSIELAQKASEAAMRVRGESDDTEEEDMALMEGEMPEEEMPVSETPAPTMEEEEKTMEATYDMQAEGKMPKEDMKEVAEEEAPTEMDEDEEKKKEAKAMTEASTDADKTVELSTEEIAESAPVAEEAVVAAAAEVAEVTEEAVVASAEEEEAPAEEATATEEAEEASAEEAVEEVADDATADAAAEVEDGAEASSEETTTSIAQIVQEETLEAPVTAAAENADNLNIEVPADRRPLSQASAASVAITAGADIPGYTAGSSLQDMNVVAEAMSKRLHGLRRVNGGDGEQHIVASITTNFPEERQLTTDIESNWAKIQNIVSPEAIVASGGHVAPFEVKYDIFGFGTTVRPVRDALPRFQADRGGIRYITPPVLTDYANAVGIWTAANDSAQTPNPAAKASLTVTAAQELTESTDAVTLQMQFGNLVTRAYPELVARHNELGLIQHAREAEQYLLGKIAAGSTAVTTSSLIGFGRDFLVQIGRASAAYRSRHRLEADAPLRLIAPSWVRDAMQADLALSMPGDSTLAVASSEIDGYLASRGVVASYSLDQNVFGAQSVGALDEFADSFTWYLFSEGTFLFLDGGTLDLGIIRDSSLVGTNDYKMFVETFEGVAKVGIEGLVVTSTIAVNGAAAALRDTTGGATAAAVEY